jgi:hypothetical protein
MQRKPPGFSMLYDVTPMGPTLGVYGDLAISEAVIDRFGRRFIYAGVAPRCLNGQLDVGALRRGEFVLRPGLVYRMESMTTSFRDWTRRMGTFCKIARHQP